jgi:HK97 family phage portal protein
MPTTNNGHVLIYHQDKLKALPTVQAAYTPGEWLRGVDLDDAAQAGLSAHAAYLAVAWVRRCLELRANALSAMPYAVLSRAGDTVDWPFTGDLKRLLWLTEGAMCIYGRAYWFRKRQGRRVLYHRWLVPSSIQESYQTDGTPLFERTINGQKQTYTPQDITYFWEPALDVEAGPGLGCVETALAAAGLSYNMNEFASNFFRQGALPGVLLTVESNISDSEKARLEKWWKKMVQGVKRAWDSVAISAQIKPVVLGYPVDQLAMPELTAIVRQQIATAMGVPQTMLEDAASYATAGEHRQSFYQDTVVPRCKLLEAVINEQVLEPIGYRLEFREQELDLFQEDEEQRSASLVHLTTAGVPLLLAMQMLGYDLPDGITYKQLEAKLEARRQEVAAQMQPKPEAETPEGEGDKGEGVVDEGEKGPDTRALAKDLAMQDIEKWQRKALKRLKAGQCAGCGFESEWIPDSYKEAVTPLLEAAHTPADVRAAFKAAAGVVVQWQEILPVPEEVAITQTDIENALKLWDKLMPEYAGMLDAEVVDTAEVLPEDEAYTEQPAPDGNAATEPSEQAAQEGEA